MRKIKIMSRGKKREKCKTVEVHNGSVISKKESAEEMIVEHIKKIPHIITDSLEVIYSHSLGILKITYSLDNQGTHQHGFCPHVFRIELYQKGKQSIISQKETFIKDIVLVDDMEMNESFFSRIQKIIEGKNKGKENELKVEGIICGLKDTQRMDITIIGVMPSGLYTDVRGIDVHIIVATTTMRLLVPLQIKTGKAGQKEHIEKHKNIPSIAILNKSEQEIKDAIFLICHTYVYGKEEGNILHI